MQFPGASTLTTILSPLLNILYLGSKPFALKLEKPNSSIKHFLRTISFSFFNLITLGSDVSKLSLVKISSFSPFSIISLEIFIYLSFIESITSKGCRPDTP